MSGGELEPVATGPSGAPYRTAVESARAREFVYAPLNKVGGDGGLLVLYRLFWLPVMLTTAAGWIAGSVGANAGLVVSAGCVGFGNGIDSFLTQAVRSKKRYSSAFSCAERSTALQDPGRSPEGAPPACRSVKTALPQYSLPSASIRVPADRRVERQVLRVPAAGVVDPAIRRARGHARHAVGHAGQVDPRARERAGDIQPCVEVVPAQEARVDRAVIAHRPSRGSSPSSSRRPGSRGARSGTRCNGSGSRRPCRPRSASRGALACRPS